MKTNKSQFRLGLAVFLGTILAVGLAPIARSQGDDAFIQREVLHELRLLPYYSVFDDIKFSVQGTHVTLSGEVANPVLKSDAEGAAKSVKGVTDVTNNIKVLPVSDLDNQIRRAEYHAIYGEPQLSKYSWQSVQGIHIIVENGHVTLEGIVDNESDKNVANIRANSVPNVFSVTNNLQVAGAR